MKKIFQIVSITIISVGLAACGGQTNKEKDEHQDHASHADHSEMDHESSNGPKQLSVPEGAKVMFGNLTDGDTISMPYTVKFEVEGMEVEPAGALNEGKGHHHLIINGGHIAKGTVVPSDSLNIHFGQGQLETELDLSPGAYQLTMQFADGFHQSYGEQMSATVNVVVE